MRPYTLTLMTPRGATPSFLASLQSRNFDIELHCNDSFFLKGANPTGWGWSQLLLRPGADVSLPEPAATHSGSPEAEEQDGTLILENDEATEADEDEEYALTPRQHLHFELEADIAGSSHRPTLQATRGDEAETAPFASALDADRYGIDTTSTMPDPAERNEISSLQMIHQTDQYRDSIPCWEIDKINTQVHILTFFNLSTAGGDSDFTQYLLDLERTTQAKFGTTVELAGRMRSWSGSNELQAPIQGSVMGPINYVSIISFPNVDKYFRFVNSEQVSEVKKAWKVDSMVSNERIMLWQKFQMPEEPIDPHEWEYGNPYEPYGECWFG